MRNDHDHQVAAALFLDVVVGRVMADMAVDKPFAGPAHLPHDIVALAWSHVDYVGTEACWFRDGLAVVGNKIEETRLTEPCRVQQALL